jgi:hypothetical protein
MISLFKVYYFYIFTYLEAAHTMACLSDNSSIVEPSFHSVVRFFLLITPELNTALKFLNHTISILLSSGVIIDSVSDFESLQKLQFTILLQILEWQDMTGVREHNKAYTITTSELTKDLWYCFRYVEPND